jgi:hypothetical protein
MPLRACTTSAKNVLPIEQAYQVKPAQSWLWVSPVKIIMDKNPYINQIKEYFAHRG